MTEEAEETKIWKRESNDVVDPITYGVIILFVITIFFNITFLNDPDPLVAQLALTSMAVALIFFAGLTIKLFFDSIDITKTIKDAAKSGLFRVFIWFVIVFGAQFIAFYLILQIPTQSIFEQGIELFAFAVVSSTSEEFFFTYALQSFLMKYTKYGGVVIVAAVFMLYHWVVYSSTLILLLMMFALRMIYGSAYWYSRRLSALILAHLVTNLLGAAGVA